MGCGASWPLGPRPHLAQDISWAQTSAGPRSQPGPGEVLSQGLDVEQAVFAPGRETVEGSSSVYREHPQHSFKLKTEEKVENKQCILNLSSVQLLADTGKARGCSTNTDVIKSLLSSWIILSSVVCTSPPPGQGSMWGLMLIRVHCTHKGKVKMSKTVLCPLIFLWRLTFQRDFV